VSHLTTTLVFCPRCWTEYWARLSAISRIVVVDDGSTDNSLEVLQGYAHRNPEIMRVYTHAGGCNLGISATVNLGFEKSRGKYCCPHASDDVSYSDRLERQVAFLESHPDVGWVYRIAE
jgi:glycosyltransferase involved in cell wall biosynthesis